MKFMVMLKSDKELEAGQIPSEQQLQEFIHFNGEMVRSGVLLAGEGLHPSAQGVRVKIHGDGSTVVDGPFAETKELVAGFWVIQAASQEEVIERMRHIPDLDGKEPVLEIRQCMEPPDFGKAMTPELRAEDELMRIRSAKIAEHNPE